ncbi:MAG: DUF3772 domain-containing protein [Hyphomicrobiaceae bacterium]
MRLVLMLCAFAALLAAGSLWSDRTGAQVPEPAASSSPPPAAAPAPAPVVPVLTAEITDAVARIAGGVDKAATEVEEAKARDGDLARLRGVLDGLIDETRPVVDAIVPRLQAVRGQIEKLGPAPAKDAPPESPPIAAERSRLNALAAEADGAIRKLELAQLRGRQVVARIQSLRQQIFTTDLLRRTASPLRPSVWFEFADELSGAAGDLRAMGSNWLTRVEPRVGTLLLVVVTGCAILGLLRMLCRQLIARRLQPGIAATPSFFARAGSAILTAPTIVAPGVAAAAFVYLTLDGLELLGLQVGLLAEGLLVSYLAYAAVAGLVLATLAPARAAWRLFDVSDETAATLARLFCATAAVFAIDLFLRQVISTLSLSVQMAVVTTLLPSIAFAALLVAIVRTPFVPIGDADAGVAVSRYRPRWLKLPLLAIAAAVVATSLFGFVALGRFIAGQTLLTGSALVLLYLMHLAIRAATTMPIERRLLDAELGFDTERRGQISTAVAVVLHIFLALVGLPLVLLTWGFSGPDILDMLKSLVFGFEIGQFRISLARITIAIVMFGAILIGTRLVQQWLGARVFPAAKLDAGVSHSLSTGLGYAGFALAALIAVSYAGLDITNLAIVAGALSVGIGFGLQSIVNNFVSGLILLVERPVKVGDWIVVKDREGIVRRISVRATEIETFDRASLIIPNSELVTGSVVNWTHRNSVGRLTIRVGVAYSADPERVLAILREVAARHPDVLEHPAAIVTFENFGDSSLDFVLRVFLGDVMQSLRVQTELRVEILKAFRQAGIEIPYPQSDVHLRDLDGVKVLLAQMLKSRQARPETVVADHDGTAPK